MKRIAIGLVLFFGTIVLTSEHIDAQRLVPSGIQKDDVQDLIDRLGGLPVEYRADLTFYLVSHYTLSKTQRFNILDSLFNSSASTRERYPITDAVRVPDSLSSELVMASKALGLDSFSIKARVARAFVSDDFMHALDLAQNIRIEPRSSSCSDFTVEVADPYFELLKELDSHAKLPSQHQRIGILRVGIVNNLHNSPELVSAGKMIGQLPLNSTEFSELFQAYVRSLSKMTTGDRDVNSVELDGELTKTIALLAEKSRELGLSTQPLMKAYRSFLISSLSRSQCSFSPTDRSIEAERFNKLLDKYPTATEFRLTVQDLQAAKVEASNKEDSLPYYQEFRAPLHILFIAHDVDIGRRSPMEQSSGYRMSDGDVDDYLKLLKQLSLRSENCKLCLFVSTAQLYFILLDDLPTYLNPNPVINQYVSWFESSPVQESHPQLWLYRVKGLINLNRNLSKSDADRLVELTKRGKSLTALPHPGFGEIISACQKSNSPILRIYARFDVVFKPFYDIKHQGS